MVAVVYDPPFFAGGVLCEYFWSTHGLDALGHQHHHSVGSRSVFRNSFNLKTVLALRYNLGFKVQSTYF